MKNILVLMSTYNGSKFIIEQMDSILSQQNTCSKLLIRDDGSVDNTLSLIKQYDKSHPGFIIEIIEGNNLGSNNSFSILLEHAYHHYIYDFDYFAFSDQDDFWMANKLHEGVRQLAPYLADMPLLYCSNTTVVNSHLEPLPNNRVRRVVLSKEKSIVRNLGTGCTMIFNAKTIFLYCNNKPDYIKIHDYYMFLISSFLGKVVYDENSYILYRQHGGNQVGEINTVKSRFCERIKSKGNLHKHFIERNASAFLKSYRYLLNAQDISIIETVALYKSSITRRLRLFFSKEFCPEYFEDAMFFKIKVLLGGI